MNGWRADDARTLLVDLEKPLRRPDRLRLAGVVDRAQVPNPLAADLVEIEPPLAVELQILRRIAGEFVRTHHATNDAFLEEKVSRIDRNMFTKRNCADDNRGAVWAQ